MKLFKIFIVIVISMANSVNAQDKNNIAGIYSLGASSPEGGSHLIILEDGKFAITYFGGIQIGEWKLTQENEYRFTPNTKDTSFELFGRHNKDLKDSTKVFFTGFENGETFIQLRTTEDADYKMQRVFNLDANCFSFPYVHTFKVSAHSISFTTKGYQEKNSQVITFKNSEGYNDFVVIFTQLEDAVLPFSSTFKDGKLHFKDGNSASQSPLEEQSEDIEFLKRIIDQLRNLDTLYLNPFYNMFSGLDNDDEAFDINEGYVFDKQKNAFTIPGFYIEGDEYKDPEEYFDHISIIYAYNALKNYSKTSTNYTINEKPLFITKCD